MDANLIAVAALILVALTFDYINGFHDAANSIATVGSSLVDIRVVTFAVIFAGLVGAIVWDLITWYYGLPTSSSHALIGGYAGAAVAKAGWGAIIASGWTKTLIFIILAPLLGMALGFTLMVT